MNDLLVGLGLASAKPVFAALLLPPIPWLVAIVTGALIMPRRRRAGTLLVLAGVVLLWLTATTGAAEGVERVVLRPPPALSPESVQALQAAEMRPANSAIVVLGGGLETWAPEYATSSLRHASLERLRYAVWLSRRTGLPVAFSGGLGHAQEGVEAEARVAARIAAEEYGLPLRWIEDRSRDTRENAARSLAMLRADGVEHLVLVTHGWHMPRALRAFREAAGPGLQIEPAPMGLARRTEAPLLRWLPSAAGFRDMRSVLHELMGLAAGG